MFITVMFSFLKTKNKLVMTQILPDKLFSGATSTCVSNEPEAYLEPNQKSAWEHCAKIVI